MYTIEFPIVYVYVYIFFLKYYKKVECIVHNNNELTFTICISNEWMSLAKSDYQLFRALYNFLNTEILNDSYVVVQKIKRYGRLLVTEYYTK